MNIEEIDTRHGTNNTREFSNGNCLPYTGVPFGMNYFAPQTRSTDSWWFNPEDTTFQGFRLTHQPSPWMGDFSQLLLTPITGKPQDYNLDYIQSSYRPNESIFSPTHLAIKQQTFNISSQLIPSMYGGILDIEYESTEKNGLILTLSEKYTINQIDTHTLQGSVSNFSSCEDPQFTFYFTMKFDSAITELTTVASNKRNYCHLFFANSKKQSIRFGTSFISFAQSNDNLMLEKNIFLAEYLHSSQKQWSEYFDRIQITHHNRSQIETFYHNLYRVFLFPQTFYEVTTKGEKIHYDTTSRTVKSGILYTNNGFWDTYKTVYPLYSLIAKERYEEILEGILTSYCETGFLPKWLSPDERGLMPGTLVDATIADAAVKDIRPDLMPFFLEAMIKGATVQSSKKNYGRQGTNEYLHYGYVPAVYSESVNHTLDYAYSDFSIYQVATKLKRFDKSTYYRTQSLNYQQIFDKKTGFMRAKNKDGQFEEHFDSLDWGKDYAEGSAWQSSFSVYHDFQGLIRLHGGKEKFLKKLIELCNQSPAYKVGGYGFCIHEMSEMAAVEFGQLAISNQPSFHYPYLFSYVGKPEMAQPLIKQLMTNLFDASPTGYPGDEDNGSMSAWYIFNSLGFYPVTPGSGEYVIGIPLFDQVILQLSSNKQLTITASPNHLQQQFIQEVYRNDHSHRPLFFTHFDLMKGGKIHYHLGIVPNTREYIPTEYPYSLTSIST